jgi:DNA-binding MarR family transcriptional regulator
MKDLAAGMYPSKIARVRGWSKQHVDYYVRKLEQASLIRKEKRSNISIWEVTEKGQNFLGSCERELTFDGVMRLHRCFFKYPILREGVYPAGNFRNVEMQNWTALLGIEKGVKVRKTTTSWIVHVETLFGRSPVELGNLAKGLADRVAVSLSAKYGVVLGEGVINPRHEYGVSDPVAKLLNRYFCVSTPKRVIDDSPGLDEGELDHLGQDAVIEYVLMPERVKKVDVQADYMVDQLRRVERELGVLREDFAKLLGVLGGLVNGAGSESVPVGGDGGKSYVT